jgi:hypothetical protein
MKIYTYYEDINVPRQTEILELWKYSWEKYGFDAIVLSEIDAQKNVLYNKFIEKMREIHLNIINQPISNYGMSCYKRWLAYATQNEEKFYFSDYDIINNGFLPEQPIDKLHLMDECCPCFGSGRPSQIQVLCETMLDMSLENIDKLINKKITPCYHDQEFFVYNKSKLMETNWCYFSRERPKFCNFYEYNQDNSQSLVIHLAHSNMGLIRNKYPELFKGRSVDDLRIEFMSKILKSPLDNTR